MKRLLLSAAAGLALTTAVPLAAQDDSKAEEDAAVAAMMGELFAGVFTSEPLTTEEEARLPQAIEVVNMMMPEGFYSEIMDRSMGSFIEPMMGMFSGPLMAEGALQDRLNMDDEAISALSDEAKIELATMLEPQLAGMGPVMQRLISDMAAEIAVQIEPGFREGMAKAYAVRFDEAQLADIERFFATPTGAMFARENMLLMSDPQVMSASMQAMPAMMESFSDIEERMEAEMEALPDPRALEDFSPQERARLAELLGRDAASLDGVVLPPQADDSEFGAESEGQAEDSSSIKGFKPNSPKV